MNSSAETLDTSLLPFSQLSWENQSGDTYIADIEPLNIDESKMRYVGQGKAYECAPDGNVTTLTSEGFGKCSALIICDKEAASFTFVHVQPFDEKLYYQLKDTPRDQHEVLFIFGSVSTHQYDIDKMLRESGAKVQALHVETGEAHFAVALDLETRTVSIVRKTPDHTIFQYRPFTAN